jgi:hypothetical protein
MIKSSLLVVAIVAFLAAGCGGGGKAPSVASLPPSHGGTTTTQSAPSASSSGAPSPGQHAGVAMKVPNLADGEKFSACMRSHGVPNFPDPNAQGVIQFGSSNGIDPSSPKFQAAQQACRKVLPNGGQPSPAQIAKAQKAALAFSACMRSHGVKDFPDPTFSGGGVQLRIGGKPGSDLDPSSPIFQKAQTACQGDLPGKFAPGPGGK